jgi:hypothetical protein
MFLFCCRVGKTESLGTAPSNEPKLPAPDDSCVKSTSGNKKRQRKVKFWREGIPVATHSIHHRLHMDYIRININVNTKHI